MGIISDAFDKATGFVTTDIDMNRMTQMIKELYVDVATNQNELKELEKAFGFNLIDKPIFTKDGKYKLAVRFGVKTTIFNMDMRNQILLIDTEKKICYRWHDKSAKQIKNEIKIIIKISNI